MSVNWSDLFTRAGKFVKKANAYKSLATTTYPADVLEIAANYETDHLERLIPGLFADYTGFQNQVTAQRQRLASYVDASFFDVTTVLSQIPGLLASDRASVLRALTDQFAADAQTVKRCTVTVGTVTAASGNKGNGTAIVTKLLDGYNAPLRGGIPYLGNAGVASELAVTSETMVLTCVADSVRDGLREGAEQWAWAGGIPGPPLDWQYEGSGQGPGLTTATVGSTLLTDGDLESWTSSTVPSSWTVDAGGALIAKETVNVYRGATALRVTGDGSTATAQISQAVAPTSLNSRRTYIVSVRIKTGGTAAAAGTIGVQFTGTGYTAGGTEQISVPFGSFPGSTWTTYSFAICLPAVIPSNWRLQVAVTGTLTNGSIIYVDSINLAPAAYHGGVGAVVLGGSSPWVVGDRLSFTLVNDNAGVWQRYFREWWRWQLPSTSGSPTLADSLAT